MTFESIAGNLVQQENFTDLTVATVDVTLVAGRVITDFNVHCFSFYSVHIIRLGGIGYI